MPMLACMQNYLLRPPIPLFFSTAASIYQDVSGLQLAKCTYGGIAGRFRLKSGSAKILKFFQRFFWVEISRRRAW
jgi:hypothetical protein